VLGRRVAVKVPRPEALARPDLRARFLREARAAALLAHPNIVTVFDAAQEGGVCYIAAEYVPGPTLARWRAAAADPLPPPAAAALVADLAEAIGYAHRRGVVHRDLKPSNILMGRDECGTMNDEGKKTDPKFITHRSSPVVPKIADFGVAKLAEGGSDDGTDGLLIGTPEYMAPEQADGRPRDAGPAADVHALGAILFWLLTGAPPFRGATTRDTLRRVTADPPPPVRPDRPDCPRDLEAVCRKCLAKDPAARYPDGAALAADLRRFLDGRATAARPWGPAERAWRWVRRHPAVAALMGTTAAALVAAVGVEAAYADRLAAANADLERAAVRAGRAADRADQERARAENKERAGRAGRYLAEMRYAAAALAQGRRPTTGTVGAWQPAVDEADLRGWEWGYLRRLAQANALWVGSPGPVREVAAARGPFLATRSGNDVIVWDAVQGREVRRWVVPGGRLTAVAPDGRRAAVAVPDGPDRLALAVTDAATGRATVVRPLGPAGREYPAAFLSVTRLLVAAADAAEVIDAGTGAVVRRLPTPAPVRRVAAAADGRTAAVWSPGRLAVLDADAGTARAVLPCTIPAVGGLAVSDDGGRVGVAAENAPEVEVWEAAPARRAFAGTLPDHQPAAVGFAADGRFVAAGWGFGDAGGRVHAGVWAAGTWAVHPVEPGCRVGAVAVLPDGRLGVGGSDPAVRVLAVVPPAAVTVRDAHGPHEAWAVAAAADGTLVTGGDDGRVRVWDPASDARRFDAVGHEADGGPALVTAAAVAPDGAGFATAGYDGTAKVWPLAGAGVGRPRVLPHPVPRVLAVAYAPSGERLATTAEDGRIRVWSPRTGALVHTLDGHAGKAWGLAWAGDDRTLVSAGNDGTVRWWDAAAGRPGRVWAVGGGAGCVAVAPDGRTAAVGTGDGHLALWDVAGGFERRREPGPPHRLTAVAYSPDGRTIATGGRDGAVRLWRSAGEELFALPGGGPPVHGLAFAPDGTALYATRHDGTVSVWRTAD
jgi:WD40 repeat protein/tRNA A-37 threonylcarbamoyl transferase component Bud32